MAFVINGLEEFFQTFKLLLKLNSQREVHGPRLNCGRGFRVSEQDAGLRILASLFYQFVSRVCILNAVL